MTRNVEALQAVMQHILDHPEQHNQRIYIYNLEGCGTAACFAGWTGLLYGPQYGYDFTRGSNWHNQSGVDAIHVSDAASEILGLNYSEHLTLFSGENSVAMLELMVKDLVNGDRLRPQNEYLEEVYYS